MKATNDNGDMAHFKKSDNPQTFLEWLHDLTTLGYEHEMVMLSSYLDKLKELFESDYTIREALNEIKQKP